MAFCASGIQIEVIGRIREDTVLRSFRPTGSSSNQLFTAVHNSIQRYIIAFPIGRNTVMAEALMIRNACSCLHRDLFAITGERSLIRSVAERGYTNIIICISLQTLNGERIHIGINGNPIRISALLVLHFPCVCIGIFIPCNLYGTLRSLSSHFLQTGRFETRAAEVDQHIIDMKVVICIRSGRLTIESDLHTQSCVYTEVDRYFLSLFSDIIIHIR